MFCFVDWGLPKHGFMSHSWYLLMIKGAPIWIGPTMWKLLIIEPFSLWKLNKIKTGNCNEIRGHSWCCWSPQWVRFKKLCFTILANVCKILISEWILFAGNQNKLQKLGLGGKFGFGTLNVFTLGSTTQGTLIIMKIWCIPTFVLSMLNMHCMKGHSSTIWPNFLNWHKFSQSLSKKIIWHVNWDALIDY